MEGFWGHNAIDGSCGMWMGRCTLNYDKEEEPWYVIFGTMLLELEVSCGRV